MENTLLAVSAPPFWHCGRTIDKAMRWMLAALMPAAIMAVVNWGIPALRVMALSTATAVAAVVAMAGVFACKAVGLAGPAILIGALAGVAAAMAFSKVSERAGAGRRGEQP